MSNKPRNKKGSGALTRQNMNKIFMKNVATLQLNAEPLQLFDLDTMSINHRPTGVQKRTIMNDRHRWSVALLLFCTESNNKKKMVIEQLNFGSANVYSVLCDSLIDVHREMIKEYDSKVKIESLGVIATPNYKFEFEPISADIESVFESMGCYEKTVERIISELQEES